MTIRGNANLDQNVFRGKVFRDWDSIDFIGFVKLDCP
jgi:hypothetical protein